MNPLGKILMLVIMVQMPENKGVARLPFERIGMYENWIVISTLRASHHDKAASSQPKIVFGGTMDECGAYLRNHSFPAGPCLEARPVVSMERLLEATSDDGAFRNLNT